MRSLPFRVCLSIQALVCALGVSAPLAAGPVTLLTRADPGWPSETAGGFTEIAGLSADGRYTLFLTNADNLLPGVEDLNAGPDVFLHDRDTGTTTLVSHASGDPMAAGNGTSEVAALSADGRWVAFQSVATNLVAGQVDSPTTRDVFLYDRDTDATILVSHPAGLPGTAAGQTLFGLDISDDGREIVFLSLAGNLVPGQVETPGSALDAFLYDRNTGNNFLVSHRRDSATAAVGNTQEVVISGNGDWVAFVSSADDLVAGQGDENFNSVFLYQRTNGQVRMVSHRAGSSVAAGNGHCYNLHISIDGNRTAYLSGATDLVSGQVDTNGAHDAFLYERNSDINLLVSRTASSATTAGNAHTQRLSLSNNGRWVAFVSYSSNLVPGDTNLGFDVFLYDRTSTSNTLVSRSAFGGAANSWSLEAEISGDGSWVAFQSRATDLIVGQYGSDDMDDLYLWARGTGVVTLATHTPASSHEASNGAVTGFRISAAGSWIAVATHATDLIVGVDDANVSPDLFLYERASRALLLVTSRGGEASEAAGNAHVSISAGDIAPRWTGSLSHDGRHAVFSSAAPNVVPGLDANNTFDVFLYDRHKGGIRLVSHIAGSPTMAANGISYSPLMSADGTAVVFGTTATDLIPDQGHVAPGQVFVHDRITGETTLVSRSAASPTRPGNGGGSFPAHLDVSGDGRWISFATSASDLVPGQVDFNGGSDVFLFDRATGITTLVSHSVSSPTQTANGTSSEHSLSADGRFLAFSSSASDLVPGQAGTGGIFVYDRVSGTTVRATPSAAWAPALSGDGRWLAFSSSAANLVPGQVDTNNTLDVFLWDRISGATTLVSHTPSSPVAAAGASSDLGTSSNDPAVISADGRWLVFRSSASNLVPGQVGGASDDVFLFNRVTGTVTLLSHVTGSPATEANNNSREPVISADGRFAAYISHAGNIVSGQVDVNGRDDIFVHDRIAGTTVLASHLPSSETATGGPSFGPSLFRGPVLSADGAWTLFTSLAAGLVPGDHNGQPDAFLHANPRRGQDFFTVAPCRLLDTREGGQGPALASNLKRMVNVGGVCGVPATARAVVLNVAVAESSSGGELTLFPGDLAAPESRTVSFGAGQIRANHTIMPLALDGTGTLSITPYLEGGGTVHVILDLSGYFE